MQEETRIPANRTIREPDLRTFIDQTTDTWYTKADNTTIPSYSTSDGTIMVGAAAGSQVFMASSLT